MLSCRCSLLMLIVRYISIKGFFFLVSPILTGPCRLIGVLGFMCMHLGFGSCMKLGQFVIIGQLLIKIMLVSE